MRKTIRCDLSCPHCGKLIHFCEERPCAFQKRNPSARPSKTITLISTCPNKDCGKPFKAIVSDRKIELSKRVDKLGKSIAILSQMFQ